jgi:hypothetical protein
MLAKTQVLGRVASATDARLLAKPRPSSALHGALDGRGLFCVMSKVSLLVRTLSVA